MNRLKILFVAVTSLALTVQSLESFGQTSKSGTQKAKTNRSIITPVPVRPAGQKDMLAYAAPKIPVVRVGFIGLGMRGPGAVGRWTQIPNTKIIALADLRTERVEAAQKILDKNNVARAAEYSGSEDAWKKLCERTDIDLVYIATDWKHHVPMALYAMQKGKHVAIEVPAAMNMKDIWDLINTSEKTRKHCMMLENCVYDFFELTTLNMAQKGLFGEVIHGEGAYIHDLSPFWKEYWNNWRLDYNKDYRGDIYPTHGIGPVCQAFNIHRGDKMNFLVSVDTKSFNGREHWKNEKGSYPDQFKNGDHTVTLIGTEKGKSIEIQHNVMTPRPYSRMYQLTGTKGFANKYPTEGYALDAAQVSSDITPDHEKLSAHGYVSKEIKEALMKKYKHPIQVELEEKAKKVGGHGGMDFIMDYRLAYCLQNGLPLDMDVYDLAEWCSLAELSAVSLDNGSAPVSIPDFTRGAWNKIQGYKHAFVK